MSDTPAFDINEWLDAHAYEPAREGSCERPRKRAGSWLDPDFSTDHEPA